MDSRGLPVSPFFPPVRKDEQKKTHEGEEGLKEDPSMPAPG